MGLYRLHVNECDRANDDCGNIFLVSDAALAEVNIREAKIFYGWAASYVLVLIVFSFWIFAYRDHFGLRSNPPLEPTTRLDGQ